MLEWAQKILSEMEGPTPANNEEVYAREQVLLHQMQETQVIVQAIRIGPFAISTTPNETYALTGLKIKHQSPAEKTMVIELANGADGYIPPPEQHRLGGYNTWAARSAGLEVTAEPRIVSANLGLLETVFGANRKPQRQTVGPAAKALLDHSPMAYWRFNETEAPVAMDSSPNHHDGTFQSDVCFYLEGPQDAAYTQPDDLNRCVHFVGGRMRARLENANQDYTLVVNVWNGMPIQARETTGWFFSRDHAHAISDFGEHLGIGGTATSPGHLLFQFGNDAPLIGKTSLNRWQWYQVHLVRKGNRVQVYLNDQTSPEIDAELPSSPALSINTYFLGGRSDNQANWQGSLDEVAVFDQAMSDSERKSVSVRPAK
jgi:hypothetical protein